MIKYSITYQNPVRHFFDIEMRIPVNKPGKTRLFLPAWRPGKYQFADFAKNIQKMAAFDEKDEPVNLQKVTKDSWIADTESVKELVIRYNYYAHTLDAGSTYLDENDLLINPVNCCLYIPQRIEEACEVFLDLPEGYQVATSMKLISRNTFRVQSFRELADSPVLGSEHLKHDVYAAGGAKFHLWFQGICRPDHDRINEDFKKFTSLQIEAFGDFPVGEYHFLIKLPSCAAYHGVEHLKSSVNLLGPGFQLMKEPVYTRFLGLCSHELYHVWNVKSSRPVEMMPYRFNEENYSPLGYVAEGVTTYMGDLFLLHSGAYSTEHYLSILTSLATRHFHNYGRFNYSLSESSRDSWLDGYSNRIPDRKVSIYIKGMLAAFILDFHIRKDTGNKSSLHEVMRKIYRDFGKKNKGYSETDYQKTIEEITGNDYNKYFDEIIRGTTPLEPSFREALDFYGYNLDFGPSERSWENDYGFKLKEEPGKLFVNTIAPGSPAEKGGLSLQDEVVSVNGFKIDNNLEKLLNYHSEEPLQISIFRNGHLKQLHLVDDGNLYFPTITISKLKNPGNRQKENFKAWSGRDF